MAQQPLLCRGLII